VKNSSKPKRKATPQDVVRLARKVKWGDLALPGGVTVPGQAIREIFRDAERSLKKTHSRTPATPA
jgi:hypothetical protein